METGLKANLHKMVERIEDERLLHAIYSFLKVREHSEDGRLWNSLSKEQKDELLQAYDDSEDEANLREDEDVWDSLK